MSRFLIVLAAAVAGFAALVAAVFALKLALFAVLIGALCLAVAGGLAWLSVKRLRTTRAQRLKADNNVPVHTPTP